MALSQNRRQQVRRLVLEAARARAPDALTLASKERTSNLFAPFSPSPFAVINAVWNKMEKAPMRLSSTELLVDLGCGDGRWLISGVTRFNCRAYGVEVDEKLVHKAQLAVQKTGLDHKIRIEQRDVLQTDISEATLVIVYAFADSLKGIAERLKRQLKEEAYVLSIGFRILPWKPHWSEREGGLRWYLYRISDVRAGAV